MPRSAYRPTLLLLLTLLPAACATPPHELPIEERPLVGPADYVFVFLMKGDYVPESEDEGRELMRGHFDNMTRLAEAGRLLLAGPFGPGSPDPNLRGIFVFDTPDVEEAKELVTSDPAIAAGVFRAAPLRWAGPAALRRVPGLDDRALAELPPEQRVPGATGRPFVLATCTNHAEANRVAPALRDDLAFGGPIVGAKDMVWIGAIDAETPEQARDALAAVDADLDSWALLPWFSSRVILDIDLPAGAP